MSSVNIRLGNFNTRASTGELIENARRIKSLMMSGDPDGTALFMDLFGPSGNGGLEAIDEIRHMKGWNWTSCLANALQFVMADIAVFVRNDIAEMIQQYDPTMTRSADQQTIQSQDIPKNYVPAPDLHAIKRLLQQPNPWTSIEFFKFDMAMQWEAHGVCHILVLPDGNGYPKQLYVIPRAFIAPAIATRTFEGGFTIGRLNRWFTPHQRVLRSETFDPQSLHEAYALLSDRDYPSRFILQIGLPGLLWKDEFSSPSKAMSETLMTDRLIRASRASTMQAQIARGPSLKEKDGVTLSPDEREYLLAEHQATHHGVHNEGRARWKDDRYEVENDLFDAREMEYTVGSEQSRDDILGQKMTPPAIVGLGDTAGFAGTIGLAKTWALFRGQPMMDLYGGQLTSGLRSFYESPKNEFLVKVQAGRIDDEAQEETKLMNDVSATAITVGEVRDARKRPRFGDERDNAIAGTLGPGMTNLLDGAAGASYGGDGEGEGEDLLSDVPTPGLGAAVQEDPAAPSKGEMQEMSRLQFSRNSKSIMETLEKFRDGKLQRGLALQFLQMLGVTAQRANSMLDEVLAGDPAGGGQESEELLDEPVVIESASVTKAFGQPIDSGLPYIIIPMPDVVQKTVDDWRLLFEAKDSPNPAHVTVFGPIIADREKALEVALPVCQNALPFEIKLGKVKILRTQSANVVTIEVFGSDLINLNAELQKRIPSPISWHEFHAHMTICYVPKGEHEALDGAELGGLTGKVINVSRITFGTRSGPVTEITPGLQLAADSEPTLIRSLGMNTMSGEDGGFLVKGGEEQWVTLDNGAKAKIDDDGNFVAGPPGVVEASRGSSSSDGGKGGGKTPATGKAPRVAKIKDTSPTDMKLSNNDFFVRSYAKAERHLDSRRLNALHATDEAFDHHSNVKMKRIETEMQLDRKMFELDQATTGSPDKVEAMRQEVMAIRQQVESARTQEKAAKQKLHDQFRASLGIESAANPPKLRQVSLDKSTLGTVNEGVDTVRKWANDEVLSKVNVDMATIQKVGTADSPHMNDQSRSFVYDNGRKMALAPTANADVVAHEMGHCIEYSDPKIQKLAHGFLMKRVGSEEQVKLNTKFHGYEDHEYGRKDDFERAFEEHEAYYIGKYYRDGATEVVSMGLQKLHNDPVRFAENDPEYFNLMVGILQGTLK